MPIDWVDTFNKNAGYVGWGLMLAGIAGVAGPGAFIAGLGLAYAPKLVASEKEKEDDDETFIYVAEEVSQKSDSDTSE